MTRTSIKEINNLVWVVNYQGKHTAKNLILKGDIVKTIKVDDEFKDFKTNREVKEYLRTLLD